MHVATIEVAEQQGRIHPNSTIIKPTSVMRHGLAFVCAHKGLRLILTMPESMSIERRNIRHLGAELVPYPGG